jgi:protein VTS1
VCVLGFCSADAGFRVLSEAERTAALYSLLQESTQVQIRFFITVLQQMARSDPVGAFISPNQSNNAIGEQLEAKMASLGIKSPSSMKSATPGSRGFQRQSTGFLTPNSASLYGQGTPDASAALAAQRSKFKGSRTSAPGTFPMDSLHFSGSSTLDNVQEKPADSTPSRERSRSSEHGSVGRSPRASGPLDDSLSPMSVGGSWASMVNTPIMSMLDNNSNPRSDSAGDTNSKLDSAAAQLAQFAQQSDMGGANWSGNPASPQLTSPHFNIPTMSPNTLAGLQSPSGGMSNPTNLQMMNTMAAMGGLNNMNSTQLLALQQQILQQQQQLSGFGQQSRMPRAPQRGAGPVGSGAGGSIASTRSPNPNNRTAAGSPGAASSSLPGAEEEVADITVLNDVPAWLRHLRLHKYTPNFEGSNWREMVMMDDRALEEKGVAALGARRKMLKTFEAVRQKYGMEAPTSTKPTASSEGPQDGADE